MFKVTKLVISIGLNAIFFNQRLINTNTRLSAHHGRCDRCVVYADPRQPLNVGVDKGFCSSNIHSGSTRRQCIVHELKLDLKKLHLTDAHRSRTYPTVRQSPGANVRPTSAMYLHRRRLIYKLDL